MRFVKTLLLSGKSIVAALIVAAALLTVMASPAIASPSANEKLLLGLVNDQRAAQGLPLLRFGSRLALAARHHSQDMIDNGYFAHSSPTGETLVDRLKGSGVGGWISAGENLAGAPSPAMAVDLWMNSPAHKSNMLKRNYNRVGIGVIEAGPYGMMITMDFAEKPRADSAEKLSKSKARPYKKPAPAGRFFIKTLLKRL